MAKNNLQTGWYEATQYIDRRTVKTMVFYDNDSGIFYDPMFDEIEKPSGSLKFKFKDGLILVDKEDVNEGCNVWCYAFGFACKNYHIRRTLV